MQIKFLAPLSPTVSRRHDSQKLKSFGIYLVFFLCSSSLLINIICGYFVSFVCFFLCQPLQVRPYKVKKGGLFKGRNTVLLVDPNLPQVPLSLHYYYCYCYYYCDVSYLLLYHGSNACKLGFFLFSFFSAHKIRPSILILLSYWVLWCFSGV